MTIEDLKAALPAYAKDLKLNLSSILREEALNEQQLWGALVATAIASRNAATIAAVEGEAARHLSPEALEAAKAAAAIMSMNNVYYRFVHLAGSDDYKTMPARLRMNVIANPGVERADFELWSLAVSAVNGCGMCIESHEQELRKALDHGFSEAEVLEAEAKLVHHRWPGNVRELQNVLRSASLFCEGTTLSAEDFSAFAEAFTATDASKVQGETGGPGASVPPPPLEEAIYERVREGDGSLLEMKKVIERECIVRALSETDGNITQAAALLGMKRRRLSQLVKQHGLSACKRGKSKGVRS